MHHQAYALLVSIVIERLDVEVRIWGHEIEHVVLVTIGPIFPAFVPAFDEHLVESVSRSEVYIAANVLVISTVAAVRTGMGVVALSEVHGCKLVSVGPRALA